MAQISYEEVKSNDNSDFTVGFFSLKKDGDEAIVRILCDSLADLDIMTVHPVTIGQSAFANREVSCLRTPHDPLDKCPFCSSGEKVKQRVYIKMLQYDPQTRKASAVVWNRPAGQYVPKLKSYIENYGPLSQIMCKIIRHGSGLDTTYDIIPNLNPQMYNLNDYKLDVSDFEDFKVLGRMVLDKNADEMLEYMRTGQFPQKKNDNNAQNNDWAPQPIQGGYSSPAPTGIPNGYQQPYPNSATATPNTQSYKTVTAEGMSQMTTSPLNNVPEVDPWGNPMSGGPAPMDAGSLGRPQRYQ